MIASRRDASSVGSRLLFEHHRNACVDLVLRPPPGSKSFQGRPTGDVAALNPRLIAATPSGSKTAR